MYRIDFKWDDELQPVNIEEFTETAGLNTTLPSTYIDIFKLFFTNDIVDHITQQTNEYASECMGEERFAKWEKVCGNDIYAYFGIMIIMGLVKLPTLHDYWARNPLFHCSVIAAHMARDRFLEIHRYLHFTSNANLPTPGSDGYDRLCKVRQVLEMINERFLTLYTPNQHCAIDEAMVPYKGRSTLTLSTRETHICVFRHSPASCSISLACLMIEKSFFHHFEA